MLLSKVFSKNGEISSEQHQTRMPPHLILTKLSYTHLEQLIRIDDELKRTFFEIECIKGTWSVRELKKLKPTGKVLRE